MTASGGPSMTPNQGGHVDGWFTEEDQGSSRFGIRVREHLHSEISPYQKIDVYDSAFHGRFLTLDDLMMVTERDEFVYHEMLVHVPLVSMTAPRSVLVIGGGDCGCVREALRHPTVERVVQCEIDERVTRVSERFFDWVEPTLADSRLQLVFDDGVKYIGDHPGEFDLVIVDSTDPIGPAVGLFQADFYRAVRSALTEGGIMAAQTESPFFNSGTLGPIHAQMREAFAHVIPYWGAMPTYPGGSWSWSFASDTTRPGLRRAPSEVGVLEGGCRYWNGDVQSACFALPTFVRQAFAGRDPFARFSRGDQ